jgi:hypothetical protein
VVSRNRHWAFKGAIVEASFFDRFRKFVVHVGEVTGIDRTLLPDAEIQEHLKSGSGKQCLDHTVRIVAVKTVRDGEDCPAEQRCVACGEVSEFSRSLCCLRPIELPIESLGGSRAFCQGLNRTSRLVGGARQVEQCRGSDDVIMGTSL